MNINATSHAVMRYLQRTRPELLINDYTWDKWKKENRETITEAEKELINIAIYSEHIIKANLNNHGEADYYINSSKMLTLIVKASNIATCYPVTFSLDSIGDKELYKVLMGNVRRLESQLESMEEDYEKLENESNFEIKDITNEIDILNKKIEILRDSKKLIDNKLNLEKAKISEQKAKIRTTKEKIVRSKVSL